MTEYDQYDPFDPNGESFTPDPAPGAPGWRTPVEVSPAAPTYEAPSYDAPTYDPPSYDAPSYDAPSYDAPSYDAPSYDAPSYDAPSYEAPGYEAPSYDAPSAEAPLQFEPGNWGGSSEPAPGWGTHEGAYVEPEPEAAYAPIDLPPAPTYDAGQTQNWDEPSWDMPDEAELPEVGETKTEKREISSTAIFLGFLGLAVLVIAGAAIFAFRLADKAPAGPDSPEEAVAAMLEALAAEDALGVAESILPSERESLIDPTLALVDELTRIGLIESDTDLNQVSGLDIATADLTMEIEVLDDDLRWVTLNGGTISIAGDAADLPMVDDSISGGTGDTAIDDTIDFAQDPLSFAVVEERGSWYPSIWYTLAETIRRDADLPSPSISRKPVGSSTPSEAVARFVDAAVDMRPSEMLTSMDPLEMRAAYDYSSLFLSIWIRPLSNSAERFAPTVPHGIWPRLTRRLQRPATRPSSGWTASS